MLTLDPSLNMIYCAQKNEQFLPSFKQLQKKIGECDGWRELSKTEKWDSFWSPEDKMQSRKFKNSIKSREMVTQVDYCV